MLRGGRSGFYGLGSPRVVQDDEIVNVSPQGLYGVSVDDSAVARSVRAPVVANPQAQRLNANVAALARCLGDIGEDDLGQGEAELSVQVIDKESPVRLRVAPAM